MNFGVDVKGIDQIEKYLAIQPKRAEKAAQLAVDSATRYAYTLGRREMQDQVNLPTNYLTGSEGGRPRFAIVARPRKGSLKGVIRGRVRATSLNRFATSASKRQGVRVAVKPGKRGRRLKRAFQVKLRNGNVGLAIRVPKGESLKGKRLQGKPLFKGGSNRKTNLYLLYGPSVQQVFSTVAPEIVPQVNEYMATEFLRQFARLK